MASLCRMKRHKFSSDVQHEHLDTDRYGAILSFQQRVTFTFEPWYYNELDIQFQHMDGDVKERMQGFVKHVTEYLDVDTLKIPEHVIRQFMKDGEEEVFVALLKGIFEHYVKTGGGLVE